jgi:Icc-related predicted phosphoesterase
MIVKFLVVADLHGRIPKIHDTDFDAIICPGDICGDDIRPYVKEWIKATSKNVEEGKKEYAKFEDFCPKWKITYFDWKSRRQGRKVLKYLDSFNKPVFVVPGNWDQSPHQDGIGSLMKGHSKDGWSKVKKGFKNIQDIEYTSTTFKEITLIGHGSTSAPEVMKRPLKKDYKDSHKSFDRSMKRYKFFSKIDKKLRKHFDKVDSKLSILLTHNVPYGTKLDKIHAPGTYAHKTHAGSILAKNLIKDYQPLLCIGGHIHEGFGKVKIRKTLAINAGFGGDLNTIISIDTDKKKVIGIEFIGENQW